MEKILFIVNPIAGGRDKQRLLKDVLHDLESLSREVAVLYTERAGHAYQLAKETDADIVVALGGDGTVNEVARALAGTSRKMGVIPCGSGNGLARHLGISLNPRKAAETISAGVSVAMDYGTVNGRPFFCTTGAGFDALVSWRFANAEHRGLKTYVMETVRSWFSYKPDTYRIVADGVEKWNGPALFVTAGNANQWGNNAKVTALASVKDGLLDVTVVDPIHLTAIPGLLLRGMNGTIHKSRHATCFRGHEIMIERKESGPVHFDGDPFEDGQELMIRTVPQSLNMLVPSAKKEFI